MQNTFLFHFRLSRFR